MHLFSEPQNSRLTTLILPRTLPASGTKLFLCTLETKSASWWRCLNFQECMLARGIVHLKLLKSLFATNSKLHQKQLAAATVC